MSTEAQAPSEQGPQLRSTHAGAQRTPPGYRAEWATLETAAGHRGAWQDLHDRAVEPNVFYSPGLVLAAMRHLHEGARIRVLMIWRHAEESEESRLAAVLPLVRERRYVAPLPMLRAPEFYGTLSTPLLDPEEPAETCGALIAALADAGCHALFLPYGHEAGPALSALAEASRQNGGEPALLRRHERALLRSDCDGATYLRATLETRRRKEAERQRRRLADEGHLVFRIARDPEEISRGLEAFLNLEALGWKGRRGTDLKAVPGAASFIREMARELSARGEIQLATLELSDRPIAAGIVAVAQRRAFYVKTAYDESLARFSPGLLLALDLTQSLLNDPRIDDADSIAVADHPMIDRIWTARFPVVAAMIPCVSGSKRVFRVIVRAETARERIRLATADVRHRLSTRRIR